MKIESIHVENFLSHKDTTVEYRGDRVQIAGDNGAGKTSATVDAMLWALFGGARGATTDDLKGPWGNKMTVSLGFSVGGKSYSISRTRGSSSGLFFQNVTDGVDYTEKHLAMTQEKINDLLGSENAFTNTVIFKQGDALRFAQMKPAERKGLIDELTGIEQFGVIEKAARSRSKAAENERARLQGDYDRLINAQAEVGELQQHLKLVDAEQKKLEFEIEGARNDLEAAESMQESLQDQHVQRTRLEGEARQAEIEAIRAETLLGQLKQKFDQTEAQLAELQNGASCPTCGSALDLTHPHVASKIERYEQDLLALGRQVKDQAALVDDRRENKKRMEAVTAKADTQISQRYSEAQRLKAAGQQRLGSLQIDLQQKQVAHAQLAGKIDVLERDLPSLPLIEAGLEDAKKRIRGFDLIAEAFSKRGIPRELTRGFVAEIEKGANALLVGLSPFTVRISLEKDGASKNGVTEGTMDVWVKDSLPERRVEMLSGGEKMRVMLAVRLATAQALSKKNERAIKTLIIDEALDGLDQMGKDAAMTMIGSLSSFDRMLFITHDPAVAAYFPERIYFAKLPDGSSTII